MRAAVQFPRFSHGSESRVVGSDMYHCTVCIPEGGGITATGGLLDCGDDREDGGGEGRVC